MKQSQHIVRYYPGIFLEGLRKTKKPVRMAGLHVNIWSRDLQNMKQHLVLKPTAKCPCRQYCYLPVSDTARLVVEPSKSEMRN
jgi:hypothetical protein